VNKKRNFHGEDLWCIKYLPKFKWENLTEKLAYDARVRKEKLNLELKKENKKKDFYIEKIE
jgi:ESF2/ABP1 family protein